MKKITIRSENIEGGGGGNPLAPLSVKLTNNLPQFEDTITADQSFKVVFSSVIID